MKANTVLIVHNNAEFAAAATALLEEVAYRVDVATDGVNAFVKLKGLRPKVMITDMSAPDINCLELVRVTRAEGLPTTVLVAATEGSDAAVEEALRAGAYDVVHAPVSLSDLLPKVRRAFERQNILDELLMLRKALNGSADGESMPPPEGINLVAVERELLARALDRFSGNQTRAAKFLHVSRRTLIYRMEKYGLRRPPENGMSAAMQASSDNH